MYLEKFMSAGLNDKDIIQKFQQAFFEIRASELNVSIGELMIEGDIDAKKEIFSQSLIHLSFLEGAGSKNLALHIKELQKNWETGVCLYRGTRLPEDNGSFDIDGVHATPKIDIAVAYANGVANSSTGIGDLLNERGLGFLHSYKTSDKAKVYTNFQFEDFKNKKTTDTQYDLSSLKDRVRELEKYNQVDFDNNSELLEKWRDIVSDEQYYESIIEPNTEAHNSFMVMHKEIYKLNKNNPDINKILGRLQEVILKDFYEIMPLKNMIKDMEIRGKNKEFLAVYESLQKELEKRIIQPLSSNGLDDVSFKNKDFIRKNSHINQSKYVGSAMMQKNVVYPIEIQLLKKITNNIFVENIQDLEKDLGEFHMRKKINENIQKITQQDNKEEKSLRLSL